MEVEAGVEDASAVAKLIPSGIPHLWHGYGAKTWDMITAGAAAGHDVRVGLEDVLVLADGEPAANNAQLVVAAIALIDRTA